jgi:7,8-dihydroneopterin aldolase/epimerase/oxygenase
MSHDDVVFLDRLKVSCIIGTTEEERANPQPVWISARIPFDLRRAGEQEELRSTIDYSEIAHKLRREAEKHPYMIVEALAHECAVALLSIESVTEVWIRVEKSSIADADAVGVEITRRRSESSNRKL